MIDDDDNPESAAILLERARGRSYGEIARSHGKTIAEVRRVLEAEAARLYDGKETRQAILVEATQVRGAEAKALRACAGER
jgi:predicted transcriptional regulator